MKYEMRFLPGLILTLLLVSAGGAQTTAAEPGMQSANAASRELTQNPAWESPARLRHGLIGGTPGTLRADSQGLEFVPRQGASMRWKFTEIKDLDLDRERIVLTGYDNRGWHLPGTRRFDLKIRQQVTPADAAVIIGKIGTPARNRIPDPHAPVTEEIAVRRSEHFGGSNGMLRIRQQGIDYVTPAPGQSRSWRWLDLQTLSHPDPYHLFVFGYLDSYAFELKQALSRDVFNHLSDEIWSHNESAGRDGPVSPPPGVPTSERPEER